MQSSEAVIEWYGIVLELLMDGMYIYPLLSKLLGQTTVACASDLSGNACKRRELQNHVC